MFCGDKSSKALKQRYFSFQSD